MKNTEELLKIISFIRTQENLKQRPSELRIRCSGEMKQLDLFLVVFCIRPDEHNFPGSIRPVLSYWRLLGVRLRYSPDLVQLSARFTWSALGQVFVGRPNNITKQ